MSEETKSNLFFGGIPTAPDVDALIEEFGVPEIGVLVSYSKVSEVIGVSKDKSRFKSVTGAWRKHLYAEYNVFMKAIMNDGFMAMSPSERITFGSKGMKRKVKGMNKIIDILGATPKNDLSKDELLAQNHWTLQGKKATMALITAPKQLEVPELNVE